MQCSTHEALASLFSNVSTSSFLLLLLLYSAASLLLNLFHFVGGYPLLHRGEDEYDSTWFSDEEEEEEEEEEGEDISSNANYHVICRESNHLIADILDGGESLVFYNSNVEPKKHAKEFMYVQEPQPETHHDIQDDQDSSSSSTEVQISAYDTPYLSESKEDDDDDDDGKHGDGDDDDDDEFDDDGEIRLPSYDVDDGDSVHKPSGPTRQERLQSGLVFHDKSYNGIMLCPHFIVYIVS